MATIRKRGQRWEARIQKKGYPTQSRTFRRKPDAQAWARDIETDMGRGEWGEPAPQTPQPPAEPSGPGTLGEALERYRHEVTPTKKSKPQEETRIRLLQERPIAQRPMVELRGVDLAQYRDARLQEVARDTVRLEMALISHLYTICRREWGFEDLQNPVQNVRLPSPGRGRDRRLLPGEEELLLEAAAAARNPWIEPMIRLALETAMRRGELLSLCWDRIDFQRRTAHLPETKNGEARSVPLSSRAMAILQNLPRLDDQVFPISAEAARQAWEKTRRRADRWARERNLTGMADFRFHDLRHEATSRFFENTDLGMMEIAHVTGHKDLRMLKRYTHLRAGDLAERLG